MTTAAEDSMKDVERVLDYAGVPVEGRVIGRHPEDALSILNGSKSASRIELADTAPAVMTAFEWEGL